MRGSEHLGLVYQSVGLSCVQRVVLVQLEGCGQGRILQGSGRSALLDAEPQHCRTGAGRAHNVVGSWQHMGRVDA
jgi:hypothetical protein